MEKNILRKQDLGPYLYRSIQPMDHVQSHQKIKNFVIKLENDILQEANSLQDLKRNVSIKPSNPDVEEHATLRHDGKECKLSILKGKYISYVFK